MKPLKTSVSISLDSDILEKVRELAELDRRSLSQYIDVVLAQHVSAIKPKYIDPQNKFENLEQENQEIR